MTHGYGVVNRDINVKLINHHWHHTDINQRNYTRTMTMSYHGYELLLLLHTQRSSRYPGRGDTSLCTIQLRIRTRAAPRAAQSFVPVDPGHERGPWSSKHQSSRSRITIPLFFINLSTIILNKMDRWYQTRRYLSTWELWQNVG